MRSTRSYLLLLTLILIQGLGGVTGKAQKLEWRLGEFLIRTEKNFDPEHLLKISSRSSAWSRAIQRVSWLEPEWNILHVQFDHVRYHEDKLKAYLESIPGVKLVQRNHLIQYRRKPNDTFYSRQWCHFNDGSQGGNAGADFRSEKAWDLATGGVTEQGDTIVLCVIDDGLDINHYDIRSNLWKNWSEIPSNGMDDDQNGYTDDFNGWNSFTSTDQFGPGPHGTPVCGIAAARGNNGLGVCGMVWNVKLMFVSGGGDEARAIQAYSYPWKARKTYNETQGAKGAFVVATNASWGADYGKPEEAPLWCAVYDSLGAVGILNVASTTNLDLDVDLEGDLPTTCNSDFLLTVTNMEISGFRDPTSGYGVKSIDIGSFGENVFTLAANGGLDLFRGTSAAAPQISGAVALLYSMPCSEVAQQALRNPSGAALDMKNLILRNTRSVPGLQGITVSGGVLDLEKTVNAILPVSVRIRENEITFFAFLQSSGYPIEVEFRKKSSGLWQTGVLQKAGDSLRFSGLEICAEYEYRVKGGCAKINQQFSEIQTITSSGCCIAPDRPVVQEVQTNRCTLRFKQNLWNMDVIYTIQELYTQRIDSFRMQSLLSEDLIINGLLPCMQYEIRFYALCGTELSAPSEILKIQTRGCELCTDRNYCSRGRPQSNFEWLEGLGIDDNTFISGNNLGYGNFVGSIYSWTLSKNQSHELLLRPGYSLDTSLMHMVAWFDWNGNGIFETSENVIPAGTMKAGEQKFGFSIPLQAVSGIVRMRVMVKYAENNTPIPLPCGQDLEFGEFEDYCVFISENVCQDLKQFNLTGNTSATAWFGFVKDQPDDLIYYQYRAISNPAWKTGLTRAADLVLTQLDSCTSYEIKVSAVCGKKYFPFQTIQFKTSGTGCETNSVDPEADENLNLFPNPFSDYFTIAHEGMKNPPRIRILDINGKSLHHHILKISQDHCRVYPEPGISGMFWVQVQTDQGKLKVYKMVRVR